MAAIPRIVAIKMMKRNMVYLPRSLTDILQSPAVRSRIVLLTGFGESEGQRTATRRPSMLNSAGPIRAGRAASTPSSLDPPSRQKPRELPGRGRPRPLHQTESSSDRTPGLNQPWPGRTPSPPPRFGR
jgi:hypothetical protein